MILDKKSKNSSSFSIKFDDKSALFSVSGVINFTNVLQLRSQGKSFLSQCIGPEILINLEGVEKSDNSGLVLLLAWMRDAHQMNKKIFFQRVPEFLIRMAQVFGLHSLLFKPSGE